jgi:60 kDa SS-A/Ro ribonucleoprotein
MVRNFVQILRSGVTGRKSLGTAPKRLVETWLNTASEQKLLDAAVGADPSLRDIVRMVHPKPADSMREALFGWALDKAFAVEALPKGLQQLIAYRLDRSHGVPAVPFQMLTALELSREEWAEIAIKGGWHMMGCHGVGGSVV